MLPRDGEALRRSAVLLRYFGHRGFVQSSGWVPHTSDALQVKNGVFASRFPSPDYETSNEVVWLFINRKGTPSTGPQLAPEGISSSSHANDGADSDARSMLLHYYDCYNGVEVIPDMLTGAVSFEIEPHGFGCILATPNSSITSSALPPTVQPNGRGGGEAGEAAAAAAAVRLRSGLPSEPTNLTALLDTMKLLTARKLSTFSVDWQYLPQTLVHANMTVPRTPRPLRNASATEVYVPGSSTFRFAASSVEIEGGAGSGVGAQFPWEPHPRRLHDHTMHIGAMYVDKHPVTNAEYATYLSESKYFPSDSANFLKANFQPKNGRPTPGWEQKPVTYVSLEDARQYCAFYNKRLPHAYEWQYFAQGTDGRLYPWGDTDNLSITPVVSNNWTDPGPEPVGKHPQSASPFGVEDLVRHVWQYTSEFNDAHTRSVILRGGSSYGPWRGGGKTVWDARSGKNVIHPLGGSRWYFRQTFRLDTFNTYHLMSGSYDRAGTISFRCVADAKDDCGTEGKLCIRQGQRGQGHGGEQEEGQEQPLRNHQVLVEAINASLFNSSGGGSGRNHEDDSELDVVRGVVGASGELRGESSSGRIEVWAAAPSNGNSTRTVRLELGASVVSGNLTVTVRKDAGLSQHPVQHGSFHQRWLEIQPSTNHHDGNRRLNASTPVATVLSTMSSLTTASMMMTPVSVQYQGGHLHVSYTPSIADAACSKDALCLLSSTPVCGAGIPMFQCVTLLSTVGVVDWAHWGYPNASSSFTNGLWYKNEMKGGPKLFNPTLLMPGCTTASCNANRSDLSFYNGKFYPSDRAVWSWTGGTPTEASNVARAGVFSVSGKFAMSVNPGRRWGDSAAENAMARETKAWKLTIYLGLYNFGAFRNSATLTIASPNQDTIVRTVMHDNGNNNDWLNTAFEIVFESEVRKSSTPFGL